MTKTPIMKPKGVCILNEIKDLRKAIAKEGLLDTADIYGALKNIMNNKCCKNCQTRIIEKKITKNLKTPFLA